MPMVKWEVFRFLFCFIPFPLSKCPTTHCSTNFQSWDRVSVAFTQALWPLFPTLFVHLQCVVRVVQAAQHIDRAVVVVVVVLREVVKKQKQQNKNDCPSSLLESVCLSLWIGLYTIVPLFCRRRCRRRLSLDYHHFLLAAAAAEQFCFCLAVLLYFIYFPFPLALLLLQLNPFRPQPPLLSVSLIY